MSSSKFFKELIDMRSDLVRDQTVETVNFPGALATESPVSTEGCRYCDCGCVLLSQIVKFVTCWPGLAELGKFSETVSPG